MQAKILKVQHSQAKVKYLVHYAGWKSRYDGERRGRLRVYRPESNGRPRCAPPEWVEETRILAHTEKNVQEAARLRDAAVKKGERAAAAGGESTAGKKRRIDAAADTEDAAEDATSFKLRYTVPFALKRALVDDWENVTQKCGGRSGARLCSACSLVAVRCPQAPPLPPPRARRHDGRGRRPGLPRAPGAAGGERGRRSSSTGCGQPAAKEGGRSGGGSSGSSLGRCDGGIGRSGCC